MTIFLIEGKNKQGVSGSWEIKAKDKDAVRKVINNRGIQAEKINGEDVKRGKAPNSKGD